MDPADQSPQPDALQSDALRIAEDADLSSWLEALEAGECKRKDFLAEILRREAEDPDIGWEALALLDQRFRQHRISGAAYTDLKARLNQHLLAAPRGATAPQPAAAPGSTESSGHREIQAGDLIRNRYRVVDILRSSPAGVLVEAIDELKLGLPCVRKRVAMHIASGSLFRNPDYLLRISQLQGLSHAGIARLFDVENDAGVLLLVMELPGGPSLQDLASGNGNGLHVSLMQTALRSAADALAYAHSQGVVHGDVSATNICLTQAGDFRLRGFESQNPSSSDAVADRRAFALLACQMLGGPRVAGIQDAERVPFRTPPGVPREQWRAIRRALNRSDEDASEVLAAFDSSVPAAAPGNWKSAAAAAAVVAAGGFILSQAGPDPADERQITAAASITPAPAPIELPPALPAAEPVEVIAPAPAVVTAPVRPRIDLPVQLASVDSTAPVARIWVRRRENLKGAVTFLWWTETGSALVDRDFRQITPRLETIPDGARGIEVLVPLVPDPERRESRTFWVKIDEAGRGAVLGSRTLMQITITPATT